MLAPIALATAAEHPNLRRHISSGDNVRFVVLAKASYGKEKEKMGFTWDGIMMNFLKVVDLEVVVLFLISQDVLDCGSLRGLNLFKT